MALDSLRAEGMNAEFFVYDIDEDTLNSLRLIRDKSLQDMDLIIGPLFSAPFSIISDYAAHHGIPVINPLSQRDEIVEGNPWVFKLIPSSVDRMKAVSTFALEHTQTQAYRPSRQVEREIRVADSFITVLNETLPVLNVIPGTIRCSAAVM
jgi:ABC-type branched-subunit amino acid transport system substrate-binding protein